MTADTSPSPAAPTPEEAVRIRTPPPNPKRLSRKVLLSGALVLGLVVAVALLTGLSDTRKARTAADSSVAAASLPDAIEALPSRYSPETLKRPQAEKPIDRLWGERGPPPGWTSKFPDEPQDQNTLQPPEDPFWAEAPRTTSRSASTYRARAQSAARPTPDTVQTSPETAPIFFQPRRMGLRQSALSQPGPAGASIEGSGRREAFVSGQQDMAGALDSELVAPVSPYLLQAGATIPAALVTALNSDLPGRVIAQVTAPVYDSLSGEHLLIPQGSRLIGTYDSANVYGDHRVFLVWNRILLPNGWSLQLGGMEATDPAGASGLTDRTDNHLGRLGGAIGLSAVLSILANEAEDTSQSDRGFTQSVGDAAAQEAARVGGRIIDRDLNLRPTLRIRPGAPVRVLVTRDIVLKPYEE